MNILALIVDLRKKGFWLIPRGDKLAVGPASKLTPELEELIRTYKSEILRLLRVSVLADAAPTVLHQQAPDPCPECGQRLWWISRHYVRICQTCFPPPSPEAVLEWLKP
jgi:hypothetical protein